MPTETKEISAKVDLVKVSKDVVEHLTEVVQDINAYVLPAQGQASLAEDAKTALDRMLRVSAQLDNMPDSDFAMMPESVIKEREAKRKAQAEREREALAQKGHPDAQGHESGQHVRGSQARGQEHGVGGSHRSS